MAITNDPLGLSAQRIAWNAQLVQVSSSIANYSGDNNGLIDLKLLQADLHDKLNLGISTSYKAAFGNPSTSSAPYVGLVGTAYAGFGIGIST